MPHESTKQRALRIELDHHSRADSLSQWKWRFSILAILVTSVYVAWICQASPQAEKAFSPGTVAAVHAVWDHQCAACHPSFGPVRSDAWGANSPEHRAAAEQKCQACHQVQSHHASIAQSGTAQEASCASCHREHQGGHGSLLEMHDSHCTRCHADLKAPEAGGMKSKFEHEILAFFSDSIEQQDAKAWPHPDFRSLKQDPGNIKFNHAIHMTAGLPGIVDPNFPAPGAVYQGRVRMTNGDLHARSPEAYARMLGDVSKLNEAYELQLRCQSCHEPTADGDSMQPIEFERHCNMCHSLNFSADSKHVVSHGITPNVLKLEVLALLNRTNNESEVPTDLKSKLERKLLGKPEPLLAEQAVAEETKVQAANEHLSRVTCKKCHEFLDEGLAFSKTVQPANLPSQWFTHAKFNHEKHRAMNCNLCHADADPTTRQLNSRRDEERVMIAGYANCVKCHRAGHTPTTDPAFAKFSGARSDCAECHAYHGGDHGVLKPSPVPPQESSP